MTNSSFLEKRNKFFNKIIDKINFNLNIYITKNFDSSFEEKFFEDINLYNVKDNIIFDYSDKDKKDIVDKIKHYISNKNSCLYFTYNTKIKNTKITQPLIFTIWFLGDEIRMGVFFDNNLNDNFKNDISKKMEKLFLIFNTKAFEGNGNNFDRNNYSLYEYILTNKDSEKILDSNEKQLFIEQTYSLFFRQTILFFEENLQIYYK